jgi:hypothetical protein
MAIPALTAKRLHSGAQGRRSSGAPWDADRAPPVTPKALHRCGSRRTAICETLSGFVRYDCARYPGCAARAATLGFAL